MRLSKNGKLLSKEKHFRMKKKIISLMKDAEWRVPNMYILYFLQFRFGWHWLKWKALTWKLQRFVFFDYTFLLLFFFFSLFFKNISIWFVLDGRHAKGSSFQIKFSEQQKDIKASPIKYMSHKRIEYDVIVQ